MTKCFKKKLNLLMYKKVTEKDKKNFHQSASTE